MQKKIGKQSVQFTENVYISGHYSLAVGKNERDSKYSTYFDVVLEDDLLGEDTWEKAEHMMFKTATLGAINYCKMKSEDVDFMLGGDLLNQIISAGFSACDIGIPFLGVYGACSTMSEGMLIGGMMIDGGFADHVVCTSSSHFATAERQFRMPLELGTPHTTTSQETVSGAGSCLLSKQDITGEGIAIKGGTIGTVMEMGITDANNMGGAMAPAAAQTILTHFEDTGRDPGYYDKIVTGDLGTFGSQMMHDILGKANFDLHGKHLDCGAMIFEGLKDIKCGASGCGCTAIMFNGYFIKSMLKGDFKKMLYIPTGALLSKTSTLQGCNIPCVAHAVEIERVI